MENKKLKFYNLAKKKSIESDEYEIRKKGNRVFAVHTTEEGNECWRVMPKENI